MTWEILARMLVALAVGGAIGAERETRGKPAGFRTMTLICLGSTMFTLASTRLTEDSGDPSRVAAQIVTGVGFLGAGAILRDGPRISGLTTAATIWITAALGMGIGAGYWEVALVGAALTMLVLVFLPFVERLIDLGRESVSYTVSCEDHDVSRVEGVIAASGLRVVDRAWGRDHSEATLTWDLVGRHARHEQLAARLFADPGLRAMRTGT
jgi:putative Mg2+ transporter-C (MgtC) family protein